MFSRSTKNEPFVKFRSITIVTDKQQYTSSARSIRYVRHSPQEKKWSVKSRLQSFLGSSLRKLPTAVNWLQRATIKCYCREFSFQYNKLLYCISLRLQQQDLQYFLNTVSDEKGKCSLSQHTPQTVVETSFLKEFLPYEIQGI